MPPGYAYTEEIGLRERNEQPLFGKSRCWSSEATPVWPPSRERIAQQYFSVMSAQL